VSSAIVFGSSGLVGSYLTSFLSQAGYNEVTLVLRKPQSVHGFKVRLWLPLQERKEALAHELFEMIPEGASVFICLGTTQRKAGSKKAFEWVDLELPALIAGAAEKRRAKSISMISSVGADPRSGNFYLKTKGLAEEWVKSVSIPNVIILRPSLLLGERLEFRFGERVAQLVMSFLNRILQGRLTKYRAISAEKVAKAMAQTAHLQGFKILQYDQIITYN
jgi:uncharacterized protein YbjT (DUF2867 family)